MVEEDLIVEEMGIEGGRRNFRVYSGHLLKYGDREISRRVLRFLKVENILLEEEDIFVVKWPFDILCKSFGVQVWYAQYIELKTQNKNSL